MQYLLHIDTSTDTGTVAVGGDGVLIAQRTNEETRNHAGTINLMVEEVLAEAGKKLDELAAVVVCAGPGSYTGLRIGMATAKGYCYALSKPLLLDNRLTLLAYDVYRQAHISASQYVSLLTARDKEYFISIYNKDFDCTLQPQHIMASQLDELIQKKEHTHFITDVAEEIISTLAIPNIVLHDSPKIGLESWVFYAYEAFKCNRIVNLATAEPFYLKQVYTHK